MVNKENTQFLLGVSSVATPLSRPFSPHSHLSAFSSLRSVAAIAGRMYLCTSRAEAPKSLGSKTQLVTGQMRSWGRFSVNCCNYFQAAEDAGKEMSMT